MSIESGDRTDVTPGLGLQRHRGWIIVAILLCGLIVVLSRWRSNRELSQDRVILEAALRHNVHPALVKAVVWRESWFDPMARGTSGEIGLMQIREPTARDWAKAEKIPSFEHSDLFNPGKNTQCGTWYLRRLLNRYRNTDNPLTYALAAYNAGPTHVGRWSKGAGVSNSAVMLQQMDYPSTKKYVAAVSERYELYRPNFPPKGWERIVNERMLERR